MLKEIHEQPAVVTETLAGRINEDGQVWLEDVKFDDSFARTFDELWITACGTAYHAGLVGKEIFRRLLRIPTFVEYAHEMRYNDPLISPRSLTVAISQSGETADTLAAARLAKQRGSRLLALTNVVGSTLAREADDILYTRAGPEISVASTKAYLAMLIAQYLLGAPHRACPRCGRRGPGYPGGSWSQPAACAGGGAATSRRRGGRRCSRDPRRRGRLLHRARASTMRSPWRGR